MATVSSTRQAGLGRTRARRRGGWLSRDTLWQLGSVVALALAWEIGSSRANPLLFPPLSKVVSAWIEIMSSGELIDGLLLSISALLLGLALSLVVGIGVGILMGWFRLLENVADVVLTLVLVTPMIGLIPMLIIAFGLGLEVRVAAIFLFAVPLVAVNAYSGTKQVDAKLTEMARSFCAKDWQLLTRVVLPAAVPAIMAGVRLGINRSVVGMVIAELLIVSIGIGLIIMRFSSSLQTAKLYAAIMTVIAIGVLVSFLGSWLERKLSYHRGAFES